jgi:heme o synthase
MTSLLSPRSGDPTAAGPPLWRLLGRLTRWRLSLAVAATAAAGTLLHGGRSLSPALLLTAAGVALLAAAGSAANQVQERDLDGWMRRTCSRPLPQGQLTPAAASGIALGLGAGGLGLLLAAGVGPALLGLAALACYNGLYTPLKRVSPLALLPGALCGALPPLIGWTAAGGSSADFRILLVATLLYLWQLPHFWRLADRHAADYRRAGLPVLQDRLSPRLARLARCSWTLAMIAASVLLPLFGLLRSPLSRLILGSTVLLLAVTTIVPARTGITSAPPRAAPAWADLCLVVVLLLLLGERLLDPVGPGILSSLWPPAGGPCG